MAIVEFADSGKEHRTIEVWTATSHYHMLQSDYRNRGGILMNPNDGKVDGTGTEWGWIDLPFEGMPYGANTNLVCVDIDVNVNTPGNFIDGRDRILDIIYTWSNDSRYIDAPRANSASSWRMWWNSNLEYDETDAYVDLLIKEGAPTEPETYIIDWMNQWLTYKYGTEWTDLTTEAEETAFLQRHSSEIPALEIRYPRNFFNFTFFTSEIKDFNSYNGFINNTDFITDLYQRRELALYNQNKNPTYTINNKVAGIERFMLVDIQHTERTSALHEYTLIWEENVQGWNNYDPVSYSNLNVAPIGGIDTDRYNSVDFYLAVSGSDNVDTSIPY